MKSKKYSSIVSQILEKETKVRIVRNYLNEFEIEKLITVVGRKKNLA